MNEIHCTDWKEIYLAEIFSSPHKLKTSWIKQWNEMKEFIHWSRKIKSYNVTRDNYVLTVEFSTDNLIAHNLSLIHSLCILRFSFKERVSLPIRVDVRPLNLMQKQQEQHTITACTLGEYFDITNRHNISHEKTRQRFHLLCSFTSKVMDGSRFLFRPVKKLCI